MSVSQRRLVPGFVLSGLFCGCVDGSNIESVEQAEALLSAVVDVAEREDAPAAGEWSNPCPEGGRASFRRELRTLVPEGAQPGEWTHYAADITVTLDDCQDQGLWMTGVVVIQTSETPEREWVKYWGDVAEGSEQEFYCRFDAEAVRGGTARGKICGFPLEDLELPDFH